MKWLWQRGIASGLSRPQPIIRAVPDHPERFHVLYLCLTPYYSAPGAGMKISLSGRLTQSLLESSLAPCDTASPPLPTTYLVGFNLFGDGARPELRGIATRASTAVSFVFGIYLMGLPNSFGRTHHLDQLLIWAFLVMAFSRCGDAWSVDALIRKARAQSDASAARSRPKW